MPAGKVRGYGYYSLVKVYGSSGSNAYAVQLR